MRILVTGSRYWTNRLAVYEAIIDEVAAMRVYRHRVHDLRPLAPGDVTIVHGACTDKNGELCGADRWAQECAEATGATPEGHPADWNRFGKPAGPIRNQEMVDLGASVCLAFPLPGSIGTPDCMRKASRAGIPVRVFQNNAQAIS